MITEVEHMHRSLDAFVMAVVMLSGTAVASAADEFLADRHQKMGATCESCHGKSTPTKDVAIDSCLKCHEGSYAKLSEKIDNGDIPFHGSHVGEVKCTECHQGHKSSGLMCNQCHEFDVKVP